MAKTKALRAAIEERRTARDRVSKWLMELRAKHGQPGCPTGIPHNLHWEVVERIFDLEQQAALLARAGGESKEKSWRAWAVFDPNGELLGDTITSTSTDAERLGCRVLMDRRWPNHRARGYQIARICIRRIVKTPKGEK